MASAGGEMQSSALLRSAAPGGGPGGCAIRQRVLPKAQSLAREFHEGFQRRMPARAHLRHLLYSYQRYYNEARKHLSLHKDAPVPRQVRAAGYMLSVPILGGLHHQYVRV